MEFERLSIPDVLLIRPLMHFDERGAVFEVFRNEELRLVGVREAFVQENFSISHKVGVLRGLHFQRPPRAQAKLVHCIRGSIFDVAVDIRLGSPTYGAHVSCILSAKDHEQLWIPAGFAHGFCTLEPNCEVIYCVTDYYSPAHDRGLAYDDPALGLQWPFDEEKLVISERDRKHPGIGKLDSGFVYEQPL